MALTQIEQGMLKDGILTADAAGRLKMADGFVNAAKLGAGAARANFGAGAVLQVVSTSLTDPVAISATDAAGTGGDAGLNVTLTSTASNSKFLIIVQIGLGSANGNSWGGILSRNGSRVGNATTYSPHGGVFFRGVNHAGSTGNDSNHGVGAGAQYLDSPSVSAGTSLTYKVGFVSENSVVYINRVESDYSGGAGPSFITACRTTSTITVMEIAA